MKARNTSYRWKIWSGVCDSETTQTQVCTVKYLKYLQISSHAHSTQMTLLTSYLMLRRSQPRMAVSLAVASCVLLWCGLHLPVVNFSCPLPSRVAVLEICWRKIDPHLHQWLHIHQQSQASLLTVSDGHRIYQRTYAKRTKCSQRHKSTSKDNLVEEQSIVYTGSFMQMVLSAWEVFVGFLNHSECRQSVGLTLSAHPLLQWPWFWKYHPFFQ